MRIAIISDTHDNIWRLERSLRHLVDADAVLHCGDLISPFMLVRLAEGVGGSPVHLVWGNNDGDKYLLAQKASNYHNVHLHGELAEVALDGVKVAVNHYPEIARPLAESGKYDLVCFGHDHTPSEEWVGDTLLLNPGELMGLNGRSTMVMYTTDERQFERVEIP
jgi:putative phosphoesterase